MLDRWLLQIIVEVHRRTGAPVRTIAVAARMGKGDRCIRRYLVSLERRGQLRRVGQRGGWLPVDAEEPGHLRQAA
jgi:DNA-binding GntR family transcriptional regulator